MAAVSARGTGRDEPLPPVVIAGAIGSTLSITRSLGRAGAPVHVLSPGLRSLAAASRFCREVVDVGAAPGVVGRWLAWLEAEGPAGAVILPSGDEGLELIVRHRGRLEAAGFRMPETAGEASLAMLDKARTYTLAREAGIPCPTTWTVTDRASVDAVRGELRYPCALKPLHSHLFAKHFAEKILLADDEAQLVAALDRTSEHGLQMLVTEIIPGPDRCTWAYSTHLDSDGRPLFGLTRTKLRAHPIHFGTNCYAEARRNAEVAELARRFLSAVGLRGMAHVEFKWDARDGRYKLIECNHRFVAVTELLRRSGLDVARFAYLRALGRPTPPMDAWREGTRLWFPERDVQAARHYRAAGELTWRQWIRTLCHARVYTPYLVWDDPRPSLRHWTPKLRSALARGVPR
jgi:D-aspartate ligase